MATVYVKAAFKNKDKPDSQQKRFVAHTPLRGVATHFGHFWPDISLKIDDSGNNDIICQLDDKLSEVATVNPGFGVDGKPHVFWVNEADEPALAQQLDELRHLTGQLSHEVAQLKLQQYAVSCTSRTHADIGKEYRRSMQYVSVEELLP